MDIFSIFITGLFAGGLTCLAVQGGLLASSLAQKQLVELEADTQQTGNTIPILSFLIARLTAYTFLGMLLGMLGSVIELSLNTRVILQFGVAIFMLGTAANLLQLHPIFRYFIIQPPKFLTRLVKTQSKNTSIFGPALLGAFTVFIPCGATQAMMAYAIISGTALSGALTMFVFILGTSPLFFLLGYVLQKTGSKKYAHFDKLAATAIILIALYNLSGALSLAGVNLSLSDIFSPADTTETTSNTVSEATIYFTQNGYTTEPAQINITGGSTLKLKLVNKSGAGCIQAFTIPKFGIQRTIALGKSDEITITAPQMSGTIPFMCSMGMYKGRINVL